ncbi:MAG: ParB N-terminal domain-containing protein [Clostridia bacterium]|nr:ParB N-terminal domain-containing protein [Clostridia bacterium]
MAEEQRNYYLMRKHYDEYMRDLEEWKNEGVTKEEAKQRIDRRVLADTDIDKVYGKDEGLVQKQNEVNKEQEIVENNNTEEKEIQETKEENYSYTDTEEKEINAINEEINYDDDEKYNYNSSEEKTTEEKSNNNEIKYLKFEDLEDYPDQPFKLYNEAQNEEMVRSIRINGIIQPLIVRPLENGKYQILSGHNRKYCGEKAGIIYFPCKVKKGLTDDEAKLYLVDANLATREEILPSERARALLMRQSAYRSKRIREKIEAELYGDEGNQEQGSIREKIQEIENMSTGNLQRYLRLNYLDEGLQQLVDQKKLKLKQAESISYLRKPEQKIIAKMIANDNTNISENQAKLLKDSKEILNMDLIKKILNKPTEKSKKVTIEVEKLNGFYDNIEDLKELKEKIIKDLIAYNLEKM